MAKQSVIEIKVSLDEQKVPEEIRWSATDSSAEEGSQAKAMLLSFWDGAEKSALRIDLWTKKMMVDEMADFYYQTFMTMADSYERATQQHDQADELKAFAREFLKKFKAKQQPSK